MNAFRAELLKLRRQRITWITFAAFALGPLMGALFMIILSNPTRFKSGPLAAKAAAMAFSADWQSYLSILSQIVGVGGVMVFGFVASWIFGSEYSQSTAKDLLALPTSRMRILNAKYIVYVLWCVALSISNLVIASIIGMLMRLESIELGVAELHLGTYVNTVILSLLLGSPIAFFALWGKGYLAPLGFVALIIFLSQVIAAIGYGSWFPWAIPGIYSGAAGELKSQLNYISYGVVVATFGLGYLASVFWFTSVDQAK